MIKIIRGCDFPQRSGRMFITFNGEEQVFDVRNTKDILQTLCEVASRDPDFEKKVTSCGDLSFVERLSEIEPGERNRGFVFSQWAEDWFVDYECLVVRRMTHEACYLLIENFLPNTNVAFVGNDENNACASLVCVGDNGDVEMPKSTTTSSQLKSVQSRLDENNAVERETIPTPIPVKKDSTVLGKLDRAVYERVKNGASALQIALADSVDGIDGDWYDQCMKTLCERVKCRKSWESLNGILGMTKYASKVLWFRTAFEDREFSGGNGHMKAFKSRLGLSDDFSCVLREFGKSSPFGFNESPNKSMGEPGFSDYVWFMSGAGVQGGRGRASSLTLGLKELCRDGDTDVPIVSELYEKSDDAWHIGMDLQRFVDCIRRRGPGDDEEDYEEDWIRKLHSVFDKAFPAFYDVDVSCAQCLKYEVDGSLAPKMILGLWGAVFNKGYDNILCGEDMISADVFRMYGCSEIPLRDMELQTTVRVYGEGHGLMKRELANVKISDIPGVYVRSIESRYGKNARRRNWWRKLENKASIRYGRDLLLCIEGEIAEFILPMELNPFYRVCDVVSKRIRVEGRERMFTLVVLISVGVGNATIPVRFEGMDSFSLRPNSPAIVIAGCSEMLMSEKGEVVCGDGAVLELSNHCDCEWVVNEHCVGRGREMALDQIVADYAMPFKVECRDSSRRVGRPVRFVKLPSGVVAELKGDDGRTCPKDWSIQTEESIECAIDGCELCNVSRVNSAGVATTGIVQVRRPSSKLCWWIENVDVAHGHCLGLRHEIGDTVELLSRDLSNYYLAVPSQFIDRALRCDEAVLTPPLDAWEDVLKGAYRRISLERLVRYSKDGSSPAYSFGGERAHRAIWFDEYVIASFSEVPCEVCIVRKWGSDEFGIYFPDSCDTNAVKVAIFSDNVLCKDFDVDRPLVEKTVSRSEACLKDSEGGYVSFGDLLAQCNELDAHGELWGVVVGCVDGNVSRDALWEKRAVRLRAAKGENFLPENASGRACYMFCRMMGNPGIKDIRGANSYYRSRVAEYARLYAESLAKVAWWFERKGFPERMSYCECRNLDDTEVDSLQLVLSAKAMAGALGKALASLRPGAISTDDADMTSRVIVSEIIRLQRAQGLQYRFNGEDVERCVFGFVDDGINTDVFTYNPSFCGPILCVYEEDDWGVFARDKVDIQPMIRIYTDNSDSPYFEDGFAVADVCLNLGFNSLSNKIREVLNDDLVGELYLALYREPDVDPRFMSGTFLDVDKCQMVCIWPREFEWYPSCSESLLRVAEEIDGAFAASSVSSTRIWANARLRRLCDSRRDGRIQMWIGAVDDGQWSAIPDVLMGGERLISEDSGISLDAEDFIVNLARAEYKYLTDPMRFLRLSQRGKIFLKRLMEAGFNFLSEPSFFRIQKEALRTFQCALVARLRKAHDGRIDDSRVMSQIDVLCGRIFRRIFRDQSIDSREDGVGLCSAIVIDSDLKSNSRGNCKEMDYSTGSVNGFHIRVPELGQLRSVECSSYYFEKGNRPVSENLAFENIDGWNGFKVAKKDQALEDGCRFNDVDWPCYMFRYSDVTRIFNESLSIGQRKGSLTPFVVGMLNAWQDALADSDSRVYKTLTLVGIIFAANLEVSRSTGDGLLLRGSREYDRCLQVAYTAFKYRHFHKDEKRWIAWRALMRAMGSAMGILHYLNKPQS